MDDDGDGVDPMALQMVSASLSRRLSQIERVEIHAVTAAVLLEPIREAGKDGDGGKAGDPASLKMGLIQLAAGTVCHGRLGAGDVSEIIYAVVPELRTDEGGGERCVNY